MKQLPIPTTEEMYTWLRSVKYTDKIPMDHQWRAVAIAKDLDRRVTALEQRQDPGKHNQVDEIEVPEV